MTESPYNEWCSVCYAPIIEVTRGIPSIGTCKNGHRKDRKFSLKKDPTNSSVEEVEIEELKSKVKMYDDYLASERFNVRSADKEKEVAYKFAENVVLRAKKAEKKLSDMIDQLSEKIHPDIIDRYKKFLSGIEPKQEEEPDTSSGHIVWMLNQLETIEDREKAMRWLGFIQGCLIMIGATTVTAERDFTRPYFTKT